MISGSNPDGATVASPLFAEEVYTNLMCPPELKQAWDILNEGRARLRVNLFLWHDKLFASANEHVNFLWDLYLRGGDVTMNAHHEFNERLDRAGWTWRLSDGNLLPHPADARKNIGNASECGPTGQGGRSGKWPADPSGFSYPPASPAYFAKSNVDFFIGEFAHQNPTEGHVWDFRAGWTHGAIAYKEGIFVIEYGFVLQGDPNDFNEGVNREAFSLF